MAENYKNTCLSKLWSTEKKLREETILKIDGLVG